MTENAADGQAAPSQEAREALALSARAGGAGEAAARRYLRRYLLGIGVLLAGWLGVIIAVSSWLETVGSLWRAVAVGGSVGLLAAVALLPARAEPVRARVAGSLWMPVVAGGAAVFAVPAAVAADRPALALAGVPFVFGYWAVCAWRWPRER